MIPGIMISDIHSPLGAAAGSATTDIQFKLVAVDGTETQN